MSLSSSLIVNLGVTFLLERLALRPLFTLGDR